MFLKLKRNYLMDVERLDLVKHLMIKISERNFTLRFDDSMSSFSPCTVYIKLSIYFILFSLENDDMESSKRSVKFLSLIFIIGCRKGRKKKKRKKDRENITQDVPKIKHKKRRKQNLG